MKKIYTMNELIELAADIRKVKGIERTLRLNSIKESLELLESLIVRAIVFGEDRICISEKQFSRMRELGLNEFFEETASYVIARLPRCA